MFSCNAWWGSRTPDTRSETIPSSRITPDLQIHSFSSSDMNDTICSVCCLRRAPSQVGTFIIKEVYIRQYFVCASKTDQSNWAPEIRFKMKIRTRQTHASLVLEYNTDCKNSKYNTLKEDQQQAPNEPFTTLCVIWSRAALMLHSRAFTLTSYSTTSIKSNHRPTAYNKSMLHFLKGFVFYVLLYFSLLC